MQVCTYVERNSSSQNFIDVQEMIKCFDTNAYGKEALLLLICILTDPGRKRVGIYLIKMGTPARPLN